jgi:enolase-phosphatase E1
MNCRCLLLDIEGTISSIRFVYDEMFPFARREIPQYVMAHFNDDSFAATIEAIADDVGYKSSSQWWEVGGAEDRVQAVIDAAINMMDQDKKATGLKQLQGQVWQSGFESGELRSHVYDDVLPALNAWQAKGLDIRIYSSGSVQAQRLFFRYTQIGDLLGFFSGHYDTTSGPKKEAASYSTIAEDIGMPPDVILFASDLVDELNAARQAGLQTVLCVRPGNPKVVDANGHTIVHSFDQIDI